METDAFYKFAPCWNLSIHGLDCLNPSGANFRMAGYGLFPGGPSGQPMDCSCAPLRVVGQAKKRVDLTWPTRIILAKYRKNQRPSIMLLGRPLPQPLG